ncbi:MAG: fdrA domain protein [Clostridiaceae bacterium]|nr:fdrA domain protein [Clostridiaceae bacterium]
MKEKNQLFKKDIKVINMGLEIFTDSLKNQKVEVVQMDWKPPAGGNKKLADLLKKMR